MLSTLNLTLERARDYVKLCLAGNLKLILRSLAKAVIYFVLFICFGNYLAFNYLSKMFILKFSLLRYEQLAMS